MLKAILEVLLSLFLIAGAVSVFGRVVSAAFPAGGTSSRAAKPGRAGAFRSPGARAAGKAGRSGAAVLAHPGNRQIRAQAKADAYTLWEQAKSANWLEDRRHEREHGTAGTGVATAAPPKPAIRQRLRLAPFTPAPRATGSSGSGANTNGNGVNGSTPLAPPSANGTGATARPGTSPAPASTNGGTTVAAGTSTAAAEKLTEGINEIYARAASGGLTAKQEAIAAMHEAESRFAGMKQMLARTMSEPGSNYGPEITEPIAKSAAQSQASAMMLSEANNALETLANMTLREVARSPRQAPDKSELAESGSH